jgi:hypothetical protein
MIDRRRPLMLAARLSLALSCALFAAMRPDKAQAEIDFEPTWQIPNYAAVRAQVDAWVEKVQPTNEALAQIESLWPETPPEPGAADGDVGLLDRVAESIAIVDPRAAELVRLCRADYQGPELPRVAWLAESDVPPLVRDNLSLYYARWLAQNRLYDEVLEALHGLTPETVIDPASLLFYRMVAYQQLVQPDEARAALVELMEHKDKLPRRFQQVGQLLERDLASLDDESLDHIARRMNDIRRRLAYGRGGKHVQRSNAACWVAGPHHQKIEEQQQQSQQSPAAGSRSRSRCRTAASRS